MPELLSLCTLTFLLRVRPSEDSAFRTAHGALGVAHNEDKFSATQCYRISYNRLSTKTIELPFAVLFSLALGVVSANPLVTKRASASYKAALGYATLSSSITGGGSAALVVITTLSALKTAATGSSTKVVIVSGAITGNEVVKIGSNTSIFGKSGASKRNIPE